MAELIANNVQRAELESSGYMGEPTGEIGITENGTYNVKPYASANVQVPQPSGQAPTITQNGTYDITDYETVEANVQPSLMVKQIEKNGSYTASQDGVDGYSEVNVALPFEQKTVTPTIQQQTVTPSQGYEAMSQVTVNAAPLETATVTPTTEQQVITPTAPAIGLSQVTVEAYTPTGIINIVENGVHTVSGYAEADVEVNELDKYLTKTLLNVNIPNATIIPVNFFFGHETLKTVNMPNVSEIKNSGFYKCINLELTNLPIGLTYIDSFAFDEARKITITKIPNGVTFIGGAAFRNCSSIPYLDLSELTSIPTLGSNAFLFTTFPFYFRDQAQLDEYAAATNWSALADRFQIKETTT